MKIMCYSPFSSIDYHGYTEATLLKALMLRGHDAIHLRCDALYKDCDKHPINLPRTATSCQNCQAMHPQLSEKIGVPMEYLGKYLDHKTKTNAEAWVTNLKTDQLLNAAYEEYPLGDWVRTSVHTHFRTPVIDFSNPEIETTYRHYLEGAYITLLALKRAIAEEQPDLGLVFNGRMVYFRIFLELMKEAGKRVICHDRGFFNGYLSLVDSNHILSYDHVFKAWKEWRDIPLKRRELRRTESFINNLETGKNLSWYFYTSPPTDTNTVFTTLDLDPKKPLWVAFCSSEDEVVGFEDFASNMTHNEWVLKIIEFAKSNPEIQLAIKAHPNILNIKTKGSIPANEEAYKFFKNLNDNPLPSNVRLIMPDQEISAYDLMNAATLGLVFMSTTGLEMACRGIHVIHASNTWYSRNHNDLATCAITAEDLDKKLQDAISLPQYHRDQNIMTYAWRFMYMFCGRITFIFPQVDLQNIEQARLMYASVNDLALGQNSYLDKICSAILKETEFVPTPSDKDKSISVNDENTFFTKRGAND